MKSLTQNISHHVRAAQDWGSPVPASRRCAAQTGLGPRHVDFNGTPIRGGDFIWFNSVLGGLADWIR
jgi:hypothetical protein